LVSRVRARLDTHSLNPDRFFDSDPAIRRVARALYEETRGLPIVSPHGHVDARVQPDHYILRLLYANGVPLESLLKGDPRRVWQLFAEHYYLFRGTPTGAWLDYEINEVFGIRSSVSAKSYDEIAEKLKSPEFRPRALFERFNIEVLATTDAATSSLEHHSAIQKSGWKGRVIPTFRPDELFKISSPEWPNLVDDYSSLIRWVADRRKYFKQLGATATDHGVLEPYTDALREEDVERLFQRARRGEATSYDEYRFTAHMLMEMARLSLADGLVMQIHPGALRDHNTHVFERFGPHMGGDIPVATEFTRNLRPLLNAYGNDPRFTLVLFTLDESTYSRELAPLAGHYPAVRLGPPWWFHDSMEGMRRFRERTTETASIYKTAGFNDDTRAFCSIPARHDLARRMDANYLGGLVARHVIDESDARRMARALAYELVKTTYRLP
jgi:glucuronate isomerase